MAAPGLLRKLGGPLFFLLGVFLLVWTVREIGPGELLRALSFLGGPGLCVLFFYPLSSVWDAWGWVYAFPKEDRPKIGVGGLFWVRLAGESMNNLTPLADWGGEPLKARLLRAQYGMPAVSAAVSVILTKSILFFSEVLFWAVGLAPAFALTALSPRWKAAFAAVFAACAGISLWLAAFQQKGMFMSVGRFATRFFPQSTDPQAVFAEADSRMAHFYTPSGGFWPSFALHFVGWVMGGVETWLMLRFMGSDAGLGEAMALEALLQLARTATFFVPGSVGVQEAGMAIVFAAFGRPPSQGVALSLVKRARQLLWSAAGLTAWGIYEWKGARRGA